MIAVLGAVALQAQVPKGQGYVYQAVGSTSYNRWATVLGATGGGGEGVFWKGLGAGADIGAFYPYRAAGNVIGLGSVSATYHFNAGRQDTKWDPFVVAGYSLFFRSGTLNGAHWGGGVGYWFSRHVGARIEFRDQRSVPEGFGFPTVRFGLSFR